MVSFCEYRFITRVNRPYSFSELAITEGVLTDHINPLCEFLREVYPRRKDQQ